MSDSKIKKSLAPFAMTNRIQTKIENAMGCEVVIKTSKTGSVGGTIISIEWAGWRPTKQGQNAQFKVVIESGTLKVHTSHILEKLPKAVA